MEGRERGRREEGRKEDRKKKAKVKRDSHAVAELTF